MAVELVLASNSPRRQELLTSVGIRFRVIAADIDEQPLPAESAEQLCRRLSLEKARAVCALCQGCVVLAADTIVVLNDESAEMGDSGALILGKPRDPEDASCMLRMLSGHTHQVWTAFTILGPQDTSFESFADGAGITRSIRTDVTFRKLSLREIEAYVRSGEPLDKAGAYGAQGIGAFAIERVDGSYTNVIGLPLAEVLSELERVGVWEPEMLAGGVNTYRAIKREGQV